MFPFRHGNWEDFDKSNFEGWPDMKNEDEKIKVYQKVIQAYKQEIKMQQNTLNYLKKKIYTNFEKLFYEHKIESAINRIPCFTTNLIKAAQFISEYAQDSDDDDNSEVISVSSDLDNNSVFSDDVSRCTLPCHTNQITGIWDKNSLNSHQIDPFTDKDSQVPDSCLFANTLVNKFISNIEGQNIGKKKTSGQSSNNTKDANYLDRHETSACRDTNPQSPMNFSSENRLIEVLYALHTNDGLNNNANCVSIENSNIDHVAPLEYHQDLILSQNDGSEKNEGEISKSLQGIRNCNYKNPVVKLSRLNLSLSESKSHYKKSKKTVEKELDIKKSPLTNTPSPKMKLKVKQQLSNKRNDNQENKTKQSNKLYELNEESCNLLTIQNCNVSELESSSTVERAFICDYCDRGFIAKATLRRHIVICPKRNDGWRVKPKVGNKERNLSFPCRRCNTVYKSKGSLDRHNEKIHGISKRFRCSICRWTFYNNEALHYHCITRHGLSKENLFACAFCSNKFKKLSDLRYHSRSHGSKQSYVCFVCFKSFRNEAIYQQHKREHGMSCEICSFRTNTEEEMNDHVLSHVQTVIYNCGICSRIFKRRNDFKHHIKTHWMERKGDDSC